MTSAVRESLLSCLTVLTPSVFPFLFLTCFAVESRAGRVLGRLFALPARYVFRLPEVCGLPLAMAFLGGYPAGARGVSLLLERGAVTRKQAGRMMLFCVSPGPAFTLSYVGGAVLGDLRAGWLLLGCVTAAGLLLGVLSGLGTPVPEKEVRKPFEKSDGALLRSVAGASRATVSMCACIVLFAAFSALLRRVGLVGLFAAALSRLTGLSPSGGEAAADFLLEVTAGVSSASGAPGTLYAFGLGFGGLCVHLQLTALFREFPTGRLRFFLFRLLHGGLSAALLALLLRLLPPSAAIVPAGAPVAAAPFAGTWAGGLSLVLLCAAFLLTVEGGFSGKNRRARKRTSEKPSGRLPGQVLHPVEPIDLDHRHEAF